jgi:hypothetical protein
MPEANTPPAMRAANNSRQSVCAFEDIIDSTFPLSLFSLNDLVARPVPVQVPWSDLPTAMIPVLMLGCPGLTRLRGGGLVAQGTLRPYRIALSPPSFDPTFATSSVSMIAPSRSWALGRPAKGDH